MICSGRWPRQPTMQHQLPSSFSQMHSQSCSMQTSRRCCFAQRHPGPKGEHDRSALRPSRSLLQSSPVMCQSCINCCVGAATKPRSRCGLVVRAAKQNGDTAQRPVANLVSTRVFVRSKTNFSSADWAGSAGEWQSSVRSRPDCEAEWLDHAKPLCHWQR